MVTSNRNQTLFLKLGGNCVSDHLNSWCHLRNWQPASSIQSGTHPRRLFHDKTPIPVVLSLVKLEKAFVDAQLISEDWCCCLWG